MRYHLSLKTHVEVDADSPEQAKRELQAAQEWITDMMGTTGGQPVQLENILLANATVESVTEIKHE